uniref:DUF4220 domain-containing protein n=1 Tax=Setaria digitata TaxID=48799 RepID=A0A915PLP8_9BILA
MWQLQRILCLSTVRLRFIRWKHVAITDKEKGLGNLRPVCAYFVSLYMESAIVVVQESNRRFTLRTLERLYRWDGMDGNEWFIIYRDSYASRFVLLVTMAVPVISLLTSKDCMADVKDGRLWDAFKDTNIVRQMGVLVILPVLSFLLVTCLAWHLNTIRIHRIYANKRDQKTFIAIVSHCGIFTRKVPFTRQNIKILESAGHQLWSFLKGSIKINRNRFMLNDECFRDIQYRHFLLGRSTKLPTFEGNMGQKKRPL